MSEKLWLLCDCYEHALCIERFDDDALSLSFWRYGHWEGGLRERVRHIWYILKHGHPYTDDLVLKDRDARRLARYLLEVCGEGEGDGGSLLKSIGIRVNWTGLPSTPKYLLLRDELYSMCWLRWWLSFKMRREFEAVRFQNMRETLAATMKAGDKVMHDD